MYVCLHGDDFCFEGVNERFQSCSQMTGLDPKVDHIMEAACLVTDCQLNSIGNGVNLIIHQPDDILNQMNDWCKEHHHQVLVLISNFCTLTFKFHFFFFLINANFL